MSARARRVARRRPLHGSAVFRSRKNPDSHAFMGKGRDTARRHRNKDRGETGMVHPSDTPRTHSADVEHQRAAGRRRVRTCLRGRGWAEVHDFDSHDSRRHSHRGARIRNVSKRKTVAAGIRVETQAGGTNRRVGNTESQICGDIDKPRPDGKPGVSGRHGSSAGPRKQAPPRGGPDPDRAPGITEDEQYSARGRDADARSGSAVHREAAGGGRRRTPGDHCAQRPPASGHIEEA